MNRHSKSIGEKLKMKSYNLNAILEAALMVTLSFVLSSFVLFKMPFGGSVTLGAACPIIILSFRRKARLAFIAGLVYGCIQILLSFHVPPAKDFFSFVLVILLDYLIPYSTLGLANIFNKKHTALNIAFASLIVCMIRCFSSILSGVIIWKSLFPEGINIWTYSILYNLSYMVPETIITSLLCVLLCKAKAIYFFENF